MNDMSELIKSATEQDSELVAALRELNEISEFFDSVEKLEDYQEAQLPDNNSATVVISFNQSPLSSTKWGIDDQKT